jgi:hypothetical protein
LIHATLGIHADEGTIIMASFDLRTSSICDPLYYMDYIDVG